MLFNSVSFFLFFSLFFLLYWNISHSLRKYLLLLGGIIFYSHSSVPFLFHFLVVILINFIFHKALIKSKSKALISIIITLNVLNLGFFKYFYFFCNFLLQITENPIFSEIPQTFHLAFPLAISFYTFQILALQIDSYRGKLENALSVIDFFVYLLFFPVLIAGPIMRTTDFFPHLSKTEPERKDIIDATYLMIGGIIKKVLIADPLGQTVSPVFNSPMEYSSWNIFLLSFVYVFQLFFDFSGLTDMARSVALYMGFTLPLNFRAPFFSRTLSEFWTRWHITLSTWLRDYLYFSMGGSKVAKYRIYLNVIVTMTIGGFWHGPDYTYIAWGLYWGILLGIERFLTEELKIDLTPKTFISSVFQALTVTTIGAISTLMFRANNTKNMFELFTSLFTNTKQTLQLELMKNNQWLVDGMSLVQSEEAFRLKSINNLDSIFLISILFILAHIIQYNEGILDRFRKFDPYLVVVLGVITVFLITCLSQDGNDFIYYKF
jgi:D-alanyl-lipoteichoic acid acyltransferase DltB (MBOAT superfamily)